MAGDRLTIAETANALEVSTRTIHRYIKKGLLAANKEAGRVFVSLDSVRHLAQTKKQKAKSQDKMSTFLVIDREEWQGAMTRLGQLETERRYLVEDKKTQEIRQKELQIELAQTKARLAELQNAARRRQKSFLSRFLSE